MARNARCVKSAAPHLGHCRYNSAGSLLAEIELICLANSARSTPTLFGAVTEIPEIDRTRCRAADRGTRHVYPHSVQLRSYSFACHGNLTRSPSLPEPGPRAHADGTASLMPPVYCLRWGLRPKDGPGSARTAAVSVWLRWGRVARSRQCRRRRAPGRRGPRGLSRAPGAAAPDPDAYGLRSPPLFQPLTVLRGRGRIFPAPARGTPHPELGRSRHARSVPMRWSTGGHHGDSPGNHPTPEPGLTCVSRDVKDT